jgi:hypothetical protein
MRPCKSLFLGAVLTVGALSLGLAPRATAQEPVPVYTTVVVDAWSDWYWDCGWWDYHSDYDWGWGPSWYHGYAWYAATDWGFTPSSWWWDYIYTLQCSYVWVEIDGTSLVQVPNTNSDCNYTVNVTFSNGSVQTFTQPGNGAAINLFFTHSAAGPTPTGAAATRTCPPPALKTEAWADYPANKARLKFGVGERLTIRVKPSVLISSWTATGAGKIDGQGWSDGCNVVCGEREGHLVVVAQKAEGGQLSTTLQVLEPAMVTYNRYPGSGVAHTNGVADAGMKLSVYIAPSPPLARGDEVSFAEVEVREGMCTAELSGYWTYLQGQQRSIHQPTPWSRAAASIDPGFGSRLEAPDYSTARGDLLQYKKGMFIWRIPSEFRVINGALGAKEFEGKTDSFKEMVDSSGTLSLRKSLGETGNVYVHDPHSNY